MNDKQRLLQIERQIASFRRCLLIVALAVLAMLLSGCADNGSKWVSTAMMGVNSWEVEYKDIRVETKNKY